MIRVLLTGFGPFPGVLENPSAAIVRALSGTAITSGDRTAIVTGAVLDVAWAPGRSADGEPIRAAVDSLEAAVTRTQPDVLLSLGVMASEPRRIKIESRAVDARASRPDVCGALPAGKRAHPEAPSVLLTGLPVAEMVSALTAAGFAVTTSEDAGKYLCEAVAYEGAHLAASTGSSIRLAGFVHVPNVSDVTPMLGAVRLMLEICLSSLGRPSE